MESLTIINSSRLIAGAKRMPHLLQRALASKLGFSTNTEPKGTNDSSTDSFDRELSNGVLILVCGEVCVAHLALINLWNLFGTFLEPFSPSYDLALGAEREAQSPQ